MLLSDAVYRHAYWLGNWRALVPWSVIEIPANVQRVTWFRQYSDRPQGHDLRAADHGISALRDELNAYREIKAERVKELELLKAEFVRLDADGSGTLTQAEAMERQTQGA